MERSKSWPPPPIPSHPCILVEYGRKGLTREVMVIVLVMMTMMVLGMPM